MQFKVINAQDALEQKLVDSEQFEDWYELEFNCLYAFEDDKAIKLLATDGGEPEDQSFIRDLSWIPQALEWSYLMGKGHESDKK